MVQTISFIFDRHAVADINTYCWLIKKKNSLKYPPTPRRLGRHNKEKYDDRSKKFKYLGKNTTLPRIV